MARLLLGQVTCSLSAWVKATQKLALPSPAIPHCVDSSFYPLNAGVPPGLCFWPFSLITLSNLIYFHGFKLLRNPIPQAPILNAHLHLPYFQLNCPTDLKLKAQNCTVSTISLPCLLTQIFLFQFSSSQGIAPHTIHKSVDHHLQLLFLYLNIQCVTNFTFLIFSGMQVNV